MAGAAAAAAAMRQRKTATANKKKKMEKQKSQVSVVGGKLDTSSLLTEFQALTDELDLDNDEQSKTTKSMMHSFLGDMSDTGWSEEDTRKFCEETFDAIGAHDSALLEERAVSSTELKVALSSRGHKFSDAETAVLMAEIDQNDDGVVAMSEFFDAMMVMVKVDQHQAARIPSKSPRSQAAILSSARMAKKVVGFITPPKEGAFRTCYGHLSKRCEQLIQNPKFEEGVVAAIFLVAIATFCEVEFRVSEMDPSLPMPIVLRACGTTTLTIFTVESAVKLVACGEHVDRFFTDPDDGAFNTFDLTIVLVSYATMGSSGGGVAVLRLLRLLKLMNKLPALREILLGLIAGVKAVVSIMVLMMLIMFFFSIVGNLLFSANDPAHFETVETGILSLFVFATLAGWSNVAKINYFGCELYDGGLYVQIADVEADFNSTLPFTLHAETDLGHFRKHVCTDPVAQPAMTMLFFFLYTIITAYIVLSLFISVITSAMFEVIEQKQREKAAYDLLNGETTEQKRDRVLENLDHPEFIALLNEFFGLPVSDEADFSVMPMLAKMQRKARGVTVSTKFENAVMCAILAVAVVEVIETNVLVAEGGLYFVQQGLLIFFTFEVAVKLMAQGVHTTHYFRENWNRFDFTIVALSYLELLPFFTAGDAVKVLRLLRLLRVLRLLNSFPRLRGVTKSLIMSFGQVNWVLLMILLINFIFSLMAMMLFGKNDPQHFGTFSMTALAIWAIETTDGWEGIMYTNMYGCADYGYYDVNGFSTTAKPCTESHGSGWVAAMFFVFIVLLGGFIMPTARFQAYGMIRSTMASLIRLRFSPHQVLVGVISVAFNDSAQKIKTETVMRHREVRVVETARSWSMGHAEGTVSDKQLHSLRAVFDTLNVGDDEDSWGASLDQDELVPFLEYMCRTYLTPMSEEELIKMFAVIDTSGDGDVSWAEFLWFVLFLRHQYNSAQQPAHDDHHDDHHDTDSIGSDQKEEDNEFYDAEQDRDSSRGVDEWGLVESERAHLLEALSPLGITVELSIAAEHLQTASIERRAAVLYLLQTLSQLSSHDEELPNLMRLVSVLPPDNVPTRTVRPTAPVSAGGFWDAALAPPPAVSHSRDGPAVNSDPRVYQEDAYPDDPSTIPRQHPVELDIYLCAAPIEGDDPKMARLTESHEIPHAAGDDDERYYANERRVNAPRNAPPFIEERTDQRDPVGDADRQRHRMNGFTAHPHAAGPSPPPPAFPPPAPRTLAEMLLDADTNPMNVSGGAMDEVQQSRELFHKLDINGDGELEPHELLTGLSQLGIRGPGGGALSIFDAQRMVAEADINGNGTIDEDEFCHISTSLRERMSARSPRGAGGRTALIQSWAGGR